MRYIARPLIAVFCLLLPLTTQAQSGDLDEFYPDVDYASPLSEAALSSVFKGKTHQGSYNFLNNNITTFAFEETTAANGLIRHVQQGKVDTGQWTLDEDTICYDYDDPNLRQACFRIYKRGNCYYHYQVSAEGRARFGFTARTIIAGDTANCEPSLV